MHVQKVLLFFRWNIRINTSNINFNDKKNKKSDFYHKNEKVINIDDIDVNKILVSKKEQYGRHNSFKYFIGYNDDGVIRPLYLFISQKYLFTSLMIKDIQLKNTIKYGKKIEKLMKIDFNTKTTYDNNDDDDDDDDDKYIKTKWKIYKDSITTNFYNKSRSEKIPEEKVSHKCLSVIILDSVIYLIPIVIMILILKNKSDSNNNKQNFSIQ